MKKTQLLLIASVMVLAAATGQANAQAAKPAAAPAAAAAAPAAPTPPTPPTFGAPIAGQCVLDEQEGIATSAMGRAAADRLIQLKAIVDSELSNESQALETEYKTLSTTQKAQSATPAGKTAWEAKANAWGQKRQAFEAKVQQRSQEMQYTRQEVMQAIFQKMIPQINAVVTQKACSSVVSADSLLHYDMTSNTNGQQTQSSFVYVNPAMNITSAVVQKLDAAGEVLPAFDRVHLDDNQGRAPAK